VLYLAFLDQVLHGSRHVFDRHIRIDAVLIKQIDDVGLQPLERCLGDFFNVCRPAVQPCLLPRFRIQLEPELCGNRHLLPKRSERLANQFLVGERTVNLRCVEQRHAGFHCSPDQ